MKKYMIKNYYGSGDFKDSVQSDSLDDIIQMYKSVYNAKKPWNNPTVWMNDGGDWKRLPGF